MLRKNFISVLLFTVAAFSPSWSQSVAAQERLKATSPKTTPKDLKHVGQNQLVKTPAAPAPLSIVELDAAGLRALTGKAAGRKRTRPLLLYLWYTDCEPCREHFIDVERIWREYNARGLDVAAVSVAPMDNKEKIAGHFAANAAPALSAPQVPLYLLTGELNEELSDDVFQKDWEVTVPSTFGYNKRGQTVFMHTAIDGDYYAALKKAAEKLLAAR